MLSLDLEKRAIFGKGLSASRKGGLLPVVVYGFGHKSASFFVNGKSFKKIWQEAGESTLVSLSEKGGKNFDVLIHDVSTNPLSGDVLHVDFLAIDASKPVQVTVELEFVGVSLAVKNLGANLVKVLREIEIEVLPKHLVQSIEVDLAKLVNVDDKILASDLVLPTSAKLMSGADEIVALAAAHVEVVEEEVAPVDLTTIAVEKKGKVEKEGEAESPSEKK